MKSCGLCFVLWQPWGNPWCESHRGGRIPAPRENWAFHSLFLQSDPVTKSRLCPHRSAFLDSCSFSELSFLAFHSDTVSILFWKFDLFSITASSPWLSYCCIMWLKPKGDSLSFLTCSVRNLSRKASKEIPWLTGCFDRALINSLFRHLLVKGFAFLR